MSARPATAARATARLASRRRTSTQRRISFADDEGNSGFGDSRFLGRDLLQGVAQVLHVVALDLGYCADKWMHHIRAVESSSQSHFYYRDLCSACGKVGKRQSRSGFEERRLPLQDGRV